jgi:hypothetical protein
LKSILNISPEWRTKEEHRMSAKPSELMMELLKELALLKELDDKYKRGARSILEITGFLNLVGRIKVTSRVP